MKVGILGAGQLGRMLALSGIPLGMEFVLFDSAADACGQSLGSFIHADFDDESRLEEFAASVDVVTMEFEHIPTRSLDWLAQRVPVFPAPIAVATAQDRLLEKQMFARLGIRTADYQAIDNQQGFTDFCSSNKKAMIAKSRHAGYDGKGQVRINAGTDLHSAWQELAGVPMIIEDKVDFDREVSIIAVRNKRGETVFYPLSENTHSDGILHCTMIRANDPMQSQAEDYVQRVMEELDYVGVLTFEFFDCKGQLMANEIAPRVHNS
jgi:5-(carboxyamino)imidazole ribonucleotide synthase